jgi:hypothetical protein
MSGHNRPMPLKSLMKNPVLAIGILFMIIFLFQAGEKYNWWPSRREKLMPSSCKAVRVKLDRRIPANWSSACEGKDFNNLAVTIKYAQEKDKEIKDPKSLGQLVYRELANDLILIAKNSPADNLERTNIVRVRFIHPQKQVDAITEGKYLVKLKTLSDKKLIAEHLKVTVQVRESKP